MATGYVIDHKFVTRSKSGTSFGLININETFQGRQFDLLGFCNLIIVKKTSLVILYVLPFPPLSTDIFAFKINLSDNYEHRMDLSREF